MSPYLFGVYVDDVCKLFNVHFGTYIVMYADDILLLAPSVTVMQRLLQACEEELNSLDMVINIKKSNCMRIGSRNDKMCAKITMCDGGELPWVNEIRYLGVVIIRGAKFKCSIDQAKRSFYRAANGIFAKIGKLASEEVTVQLLKQKCWHILLYALDVCNLDKRSMLSLDFSLHLIDFL